MLGGCAQLEREPGLESVILVIDEIQKIANWSEVVKKEWDDDTFHDRNIKVLLLGSSRVLWRKACPNLWQGGLRRYA